MAAGLKSSLDEAVAKLDEEKIYCDNRIGLEKQAKVDALKVAADDAAAREALLRKSLADSQKQTRDAAKQTSDEQFMHLVWGAGGIGVGLLVGVVVGGGLVIYLSHATP